MEFPYRLAAALDVPLDDAAVAEILDVARDVAHATERRFAPVTAYLLGVYVGARSSGGAAAITGAAQDAVRIVTDVLHSKE